MIVHTTVFPIWSAYSVSRLLLSLVTSKSFRFSPVCPRKLVQYVGEFKQAKEIHTFWNFSYSLCSFSFLCFLCIFISIPNSSFGRLTFLLTILVVWHIWLNRRIMSTKSTFFAEKICSARAPKPFRAFESSAS